MVRPVALGLAVLALALTAGCGAGAGSDDPGRLTIALAEDPDDLDPTVSSTFVARIVFAHMCEKLYDVGEGIDVVPQLAAELPRTSADGRTVTIPLRRGIRFNDGTPLDAAAVRTSLLRHVNLDTSSRAGELAPLRDVEVVDDHTVRLRLAQRFAPLTALLADRAGMIMSPRALERLGDDFARDPVCVGPFEFEDRVASDRIDLVKSDDYYDRDRVSLDSIRFQIITEGPVRASNLRSGDVDLAERLEPTDVVSIEGDDSIRLEQRTSLGYQRIVLNVGNVDGTGEPFREREWALADPRLREAFDLSLDRDVINRVVFFGENVPGCSPVSPVTRIEPDLRCPERDLERARQLIADSGAQTPVRVPLIVAPDSQALRLGEVIQAMAAEAGFEVELEPTEFTTGLDRADQGDFDAIQTGWSGRVDPDGNLFNQEESSGPNNYAGAGDDAIDAELARARTIEDPAQRRRAYQALLADLRERRSTIWLYHENLQLGIRDGIEGVQYRADTLPRLSFARRTG